MASFFGFLRWLESFYWGYIGFGLAIAIGLFLTYKSKGYQFSVICNIKKYIKILFSDASSNGEGVHPIRLYFASIGGMVGLGNMVSVVTVVTIGGPGGVFWMWIAGFAGMLIKYSEIYLGIKYRKKNSKGSYDGGPMYYLKEAFHSKYVAKLFCVLLCIYCVDVFQFTVLTDHVTSFSKLDKKIVVFALLAIIIYNAIGGVKRLATLCVTVMPIFLVSYLVLCFIVIAKNYNELIAIFPMIFKSAFTGHAAVGGFLGSAFVIAAQEGIKRAVYSGDIGIGYDSIVQSETRATKPESQARIGIFGLFSDMIICTTTCLVLLSTGYWKSDLGIENSEYIPKIFASLFDFSDIFIIALYFVVATMTVVGYFVTGIKAAKYLNEKWGPVIYIIYASSILVFLSFYKQNDVILLMSLTGGLLMAINLIGIFKLRNKIEFIK